MRHVVRLLAWSMLVCLFVSFPAIANEVNDNVPGHWLELRVNLDENIVFGAARSDID